MLWSANLVLAACTLAWHVAALPTRARSATILKRQEDLLDEYDFIVAGAGTAGLTLGDRLSESGQYSVLVVEYGYLDGSFAIMATGPDSDIMKFDSDFYAGTRFYNITSEPLEFVGGGQQDVLAGCVVGGSSAVNGMMFDRGSAADYDSWVAAAGPDHEAEFAAEWGWDNMYPAFRKSVTFHPPDEAREKEYGLTYDLDAWGDTTPIHASFGPYLWPSALAIMDAFKALDGMKAPVEHADGSAVGIFFVPNSIEPSSRTRSYARLGHYDNGADERANFHLLPAHRVTKVVLEEGDGDGDEYRATGVHITPRDGPMFEDGPKLVRAAREITVSAGTIHTPQVLQRSGIGPKHVLEAAGVDVKVELPGVGFNLQDHSHFSLSFNFTTNLEPNPNWIGTNAEFTTMAYELWQANKTGPLSAEVNIGAFLPLAFTDPDRAEAIASALEAQDPEEHLPTPLHPTLLAGYKQQVQTMARMLRSDDSAELEWLVTGHDSFAIINIKTASRGTIYLSPDDDGQDRGHVEPVVDWRTLSNPLDGEVMAEWVRFGRRFVTQSPAMVETFHPVELNPGADVTETDDIVGWIKERLRSSNGHLVGTAALGPRELGGVVGPGLLVHGVLGLSVADNSIMTLIPGTHTSSTAYAIGERAAEIILKRAESMVVEEVIEDTNKVEEAPEMAEPVPKVPVEEGEAE